jgi:7,8-dihydro-6-hydroxymethylpterin-pyrophosphokinase
MTDQTRWGIPEVQTRNKVKKHQDDNFNAAVKAAEALTRINLIHLMTKLEKILKEKEEKYEREAKERANQKIHGGD